MEHNDKNTMIAQICGSGSLQEVLNKIVSLKSLTEAPTPPKNMFHKATKIPLLSLVYISVTKRSLNDLDLDFRPTITTISCKT